MKFTASQNITQKQSIVITAQLQQAIKLLQMNNFELGQFLEEQSTENPFLEVETPNQHETPSAAPDTPEQTASPAATDIKSGEASSDTPITNEGMENTFDTSMLDLGDRKSSGTAQQDWDLIASTVEDTPPSLYAYVCQEIDQLLDDPKERMIGYAMAEALEPSGWLGQSVEQITQMLRVSEDITHQVLAKLQTIEPAGLFARSLRECLTLQAIANGTHCEEFDKLLANLDLLAMGDLVALKRACGVSQDRLRKLVSMLRSFNPKPGTLFDGGSTPIRAPDLIVSATPDGWKVDLNRTTMPSVQVNRDYAQTALKSVRNDEDKKFMSERVADANWLRRAIDQRNTTTLAIGAEIVRRQQDFLDKGIEALRPLVLRDIAEAIDVHESTVSRVTSGLMIATPQGTFRLKALFSVGLQGNGEDGTEAASAIKYKIKKLIDAEPPTAPYSDDKIVTIMAKDGIKLARRTVAKYRDMQSIPSSVQRRRAAAVAGLA
ncbi:RNA polymerase sigma-54 factor 1 [Nereida ignava]|uniref:RNA polymerase sigma-54 factor n=1 Tax=Nereida ignava TaxID=282199 RepID=A0A0U1NMZ9_9RHOB|nr:RNA polymerase factor sigma-54 [Nereida ignava]CRK76111.1 RNA polymerase sigma-54 factor 1 [Nereida ignava]SFJ56341.1 RNA polymerase, sigma 54 subunit, RpoN/SigL [Nereida ignava DSM 16309]